MPSVKFPLSLIRSLAPNRAPEYMDECLSRGVVIGDEIEFSESDYSYLCRFRTSSVGLGDRVASIARPIAKTIDAALGTDIEHCGGCDERRRWLNQLTQRPSIDGPAAALRSRK